MQKYTFVVRETGISRHNGEQLSAPLKLPNTIECSSDVWGVQGGPLDSEKREFQRLIGAVFPGENRLITFFGNYLFRASQYRTQRNFF